MTTPDRTQDLLRQMLERRAGAPPPGWLLPGVAETVRQTRQVRRGPSWPGLPAMPRLGRLALITAAVILLLALAAGVLVAAGIILPAPEPSPRAIVLAPSPSATADPATPEPTEAPTDRPPAATPATPAFAPDSLAVVTTEGDGLRVRTKPSVGADSKKLTPLLDKGSRMLIVRGPVKADGYDWYEVQTDNDLFGWVAAGKGIEHWIDSTEPECTDSLDESALWIVRPIDFLVCYGDAPVEVGVRWADSGEVGVYTGDAITCAYAGEGEPCTARPTWLFDVRHFTFANPDAPKPDLFAAVRDPVLNRLRALPQRAEMTMTVAMDAARAGDCRLVDDRGRDVISRDEAVTRCRLTFAVRDISWDPTRHLSERDSLAAVIRHHLPVHTAPDGPLAGFGLTSGDEVLVVDGPVAAGGSNWYALIPYGRMGAPLGWVPSITTGGDWTIAAVTPECPSTGDWRQIAEIVPVMRLACFGSTAITENLSVVRLQEPEPAWGACDQYRSEHEFNTSCVANPLWLASFSGIEATDAKGRGMGVELRFDPAQIDRASIPATPTVMKVTGSFANAAAADCRVTNPDTGETLIDQLEATAYCRSQFVVTNLAPVP